MCGEKVFECKDGYTVDAVGFANDIIILGQSRKEGNIWDGKVTLLATETSATIEKIIVAGVSAVDCCPSTGNSYVGRDDGDLSIFNNCLEEIGTMSVHDDIITSLSVDPFNSVECVTVGWDGHICLVNTASGKANISNGHSGIINDISHSKKSTGIFGTIGQDSFLRLWDCRCINQGCTSVLPLQQIGTTCCWSSQSEYLIACGMEDGSIHVADIRKSNIFTSKNDHGGRVTALFSPESVGDAQSRNDFFISSSVDKSFYSQAFDLCDSHFNRMSTDHFYATDAIWVENLNEKSAVVAGCSDGSVRVIDAITIIPS